MIDLPAISYFTLFIVKSVVKFTLFINKKYN